jgi:hypothetical protein
MTHQRLEFFLQGMALLAGVTCLIVFLGAIAGVDTYGPHPETRGLNLPPSVKIAFESVKGLLQNLR